MSADEKTLYKIEKREEILREERSVLSYAVVTNISQVGLFYYIRYIFTHYKVEKRIFISECGVTIRDSIEQQIIRKALMSCNLLRFCSFYDIIILANLANQ